MEENEVGSTPRPHIVQVDGSDGIIIDLALDLVRDRAEVDSLRSLLTGFASYEDPRPLALTREEHAVLREALEAALADPVAAADAGWGEGCAEAAERILRETPVSLGN